MIVRVKNPLSRSKQWDNFLVSDDVTIWEEGRGHVMTFLQSLMISLRSREKEEALASLTKWNFKEVGSAKRRASWKKHLCLRQLTSPRRYDDVILRVYRTVREDGKKPALTSLFGKKERSSWGIITVPYRHWDRGDVIDTRLYEPRRFQTRESS